MNSLAHLLRSWFQQDARHFQIVSQLTFLACGILMLGWEGDYLNYAAAFAGALGTQGIFVRLGHAPAHSMKSALITSLGLSLLLRANSPLLFFLAGAVSIAQKFAFRRGGKHLWNPAVFGIVLSILLSGGAWVSPGQWGSTALVVFIVGTAGLAVLSRVKRLETGLTFLLVLAALEFSRSVVYLGWGPEVLLHRLGSGSLWLFSFFMITDPMTIPDRRWARIAWSAAVAVVSFCLSHFYFVPAAPLWTLALATPLTPFIDRLAGRLPFQWNSTHFPVQAQLLTSAKQLPLLLAGAGLLATLSSSAFCGFYVARADATLFNNRSEVILVRDGLRTVITMSNDFKGDVRDFAMVVPVPVVLKESDIRIADRGIFEKLDAYSSPRLVEYYDSPPCGYPIEDLTAVGRSAVNAPLEAKFIEEGEAEESTVTIEASYAIGEYDILILSATESEGLRDWLITNGYRIPPTADEVLQPYVRSNTKFFVVKVNLDRMQRNGFDYLNPLQISFEHEKFMLPIRLGMANSQGTQDLIVYAFTRSGRVECTNYRTVRMPSDREVPEFVQQDFGSHYRDIFGKQWRSEGRNAIFLEYAWNVSPSFAGMKCDPCVGPPPIYQDFASAGVWWASDWTSPQSVFFTRLHVRYSRDRFPADLQFQVTPNTENFQVRYVIRHPSEGPFDCGEGKKYLESLRNRRALEVDELYALSGKPNAQSWSYIHAYDRYLLPEEKGRRGRIPQEGEKGGPCVPDEHILTRPEEEDEDRGSVIPAVASPNAPDRKWLVSAMLVLSSIGIFWLSRRKTSGTCG